MYVCIVSCMGILDNGISSREGEHAHKAQLFGLWFAAACLLLFAACCCSYLFAAAACLLLLVCCCKRGWPRSPTTSLGCGLQGPRLEGFTSDSLHNNYTGSYCF